MFKVYVSAFEDNGIKKWGLFYKDKKGNIQHLTEDFKPLVSVGESYDGEAGKDEARAIRWRPRSVWLP